MIIAVTGHRPDKLGGYTWTASARLQRFALHWFDNNHADKVITGMADGWDLAVASACRRLEIPYVAAIPFWGQEARWSTDARAQYCELRDAAEETVVLSDAPSMAAYHIRNRWMVDQCQQLWALWDGDQTGGTAATVRYAGEIGRPVVNLWDEWVKWE